METNFIASWNCKNFLCFVFHEKLSWHESFSVFKVVNYSRGSLTKTLCWQNELALALWNRFAKPWIIYTATKLFTWIWRWNKLKSLELPLDFHCDPRESEARNSNWFSFISLQQPENVLCMSKSGNRIKLIDFGFARRYDPNKKLQVRIGFCVNVEVD